MRESQTTILLTAALVILLALLVFTSVHAINITSAADPANTGIPESTELPEDEPAAKRGLVTENGHIYFYNEDSTLFTGGYKELRSGETTDYYYFLANGQAYTSGYKAVEMDGIPYYFYFEENGKAFTGGLKEVTFGTEVCTYYFQDNGRALTSGWKTIQETKYYFQANGRAAQEAFVTLDNSIYYFDDHASLITDGWFCVEAEEGYYYAGPTGALATDTVIDGYKLDAGGKSSTKYRIIQYVNQHTDSAMSSQEKIQALYDWVLESDMTYIRTYEHVRPDWQWEDGWVDDMAASHMDHWGGNCFRYAAFLGMMIREATGLPVAVYHGQTPATFSGLTPHSWTCVYQDGNWYIYDVEMNKFNVNTRSSCYKVPASESSLHLKGEGTNLYS